MSLIINLDYINVMTHRLPSFYHSHIFLNVHPLMQYLLYSYSNTAMTRLIYLIIFSFFNQK